MATAKIVLKAYKVGRRDMLWQRSQEGMILRTSAKLLVVPQRHFEIGRNNKKTFEWKR